MGVYLFFYTSTFSVFGEDTQLTSGGILYRDCGCLNDYDFATSYAVQNLRAEPNLVLHLSPTLGK